MNHFTVDILTPSKIVAQNVPAESLLVPTVKGQINILQNHTHVISKLETGVITVFGSEQDPDRYFSVSTGTCKVLNDKVTVLASTAEEDKDIDFDRAKQALKRAEEMLNKTDGMSDEQILKFQRKLERAHLRLQMMSFKG